jgi:hypothetical protein
MSDKVMAKLDWRLITVRRSACLLHLMYDVQHNQTKIKTEPQRNISENGTISIKN